MIVDIEIIEKYNNWKAEKGVASKDFSPQQFQIEYAKELALERLTAVAEYIEARLKANPAAEEERHTLENLQLIIEGKDV